MREIKMIMKRCTKVLLSLCVAIFLVGCEANQQLPVDVVGELVPNSEINHRMRLDTPDGINTFKTSESIAIGVESVSKDYITFLYSDIKMFLLEDEQWVEVDNFTDGYPDQYILSPAKQATVPKLIVLSPILPDPAQPVTLCIVIIGHVMRGGEITNEHTADYICIELKP